MAGDVVRRPWRAAVGAAFLLCASLAHPQPAAPAASPQIQLCMACHGPQGNTQVPTTPSLAGQPRIFLENQLVLIRDGMRVVPEMKGVLDGVKDEDLVRMATYFSAQKPEQAEKGTAKADVYQRGQAIAAKALCASCHAADYAGRQQIPRLAGQPEPFLMQSLRQFRDRPEPGRDTIMAAVLLGMKDGELADLAHFFAYFR